MRPGPSVAVVAGLVIAALVLTSAVLVSARARAGSAERDASARLEERYRDLRERLRARTAGDPLLALASGSAATVALAMRESVFVELVEDAAGAYLDRIEVDLAHQIDGHGDGDLETKTPFGTMTLGEWRVVVKVHEMKAVLATRRPTVTVAGANRLDVAIPVRVEGGRGAVTLDFGWNSKGVVNLLCWDWTSRQHLEGAILPRDYVVRGALDLSARPGGILADPDFPEEKFPIAMELDAASWAGIRAALEKENALSRCGILIKPEKIERQLREFGRRGLRFKLPRTMFRRLSLPAQLSESVRILDAPVRITVATDTLRLEGGLLWYAAEVEAHRTTEPPVPMPLPSADPPRRPG